MQGAGNEEQGDSETEGYTDEEDNIHRITHEGKVGNGEARKRIPSVPGVGEITPNWHANSKRPCADDANRRAHSRCMVSNPAKFPAAEGPHASNRKIKP